MSDAIFVPVCSDEDRTFPYPYDCSKYYQCASGRPILMDCPPGTHFDRSVNVCNWPDAANCTPIPYPG